MKSYIIRLSDFSSSVELANAAFISAKLYNWDIHFFEGINGLRSTLQNYDLQPAKIKKSKSLDRKGVVGCFLSHYSLWNKCIELNEPICILEHDTTIHKPFPRIDCNKYDVIRLAVNKPAKHISNLNIGQWWVGAMAYIVTPTGAGKLVNFSKKHGALPADIMLSANIVNTLLYSPLNSVVTFKHAVESGGISFTRDLEENYNGK